VALPVALDFAAGRLDRPFGDALGCELAYYLIYRPRADGDPGIAAFKNWICAEAKADGPRILDALLDAVSAALWHISQVKLDRPPRMADFVKWITAAKYGLEQ
jgi:hypothetical protein